MSRAFLPFWSGDGRRCDGTARHSVSAESEQMIQMMMGSSSTLVLPRRLFSNEGVGPV
uniref:Uncharacterized protein n=1 Tax=Physcomitrium patens TaxID=3218 RepID=A0A2K1JYI0_PHYPA|nr:hypothetical protein PHYPA_013706 [Physcomitrium patens]